LDNAAELLCVDSCVFPQHDAFLVIMHTWNYGVRYLLQFLSEKFPLFLVCFLVNSNHMEFANKKTRYEIQGKN
jgi:hypothetical protein